MNIASNILLTPPTKDTATISNTCTAGVTDICQRYTGNNNGGEPPKTGAGNDGTYCKYDATVTKKSTCF